MKEHPIDEKLDEIMDFLAGLIFDYKLMTIEAQVEMVDPAKCLINLRIVTPEFDECTIRQVVNKEGPKLAEVVQLKKEKE